MKSFWPAIAALLVTTVHLTISSWAQVAQMSVDAALRPAPQDAPWWRSRWKAKLKEVADRPDCRLVFLGDSITQGWETAGVEIWKKYYSNRRAMNLGFGGDRTENVLWRIENGTLDGLDPELVVLMIGTNNAGFRQEDPQQTADGIQAIVEQLEARCPNGHILLLAIFPRGKAKNDRMRQLVERTNARIQKLDERRRVTFVNIFDAFLAPDGSLPDTIMPDGLHPNASGYQIWADELERFLSPWLDEGAGENGEEKEDGLSDSRADS